MVEMRDKYKVLRERAWEMAEMRETRGECVRLESPKIEHFDKDRWLQYNVIMYFRDEKY